MRLVSCKNWSAVTGTPSSLTAAALKAAEKLFVTFLVERNEKLFSVFQTLAVRDDGAPISRSN